MRVKSIILTVDQGENMTSHKAKVLHPILGKALISYTIDAISQMDIERICILQEDQSDDIKNTLGHSEKYVFQEVSKITQITNFVGDCGNIVVLSGDTPLITSLAIEKTLKFHDAGDNGVTILSAKPNKSEDYGQIYVFKAKVLTGALRQVRENNQKDYCLQDLVEIVSKDGCKVDTLDITNGLDLLKVSSRSQLAQCTRIMKQRINEKHMDNGVTLEDPTNTYIGPEVTIGFDTIIEPNCMLKGRTTIGRDCFIGNGSNIENGQISDGVHIESSHIHDSFIDDHAHVGPFAYIRPHSSIGKNVRIGDFVEIKNSSIGDYTKVSHLTYVGDADVGEHVNFGCGTVLVNYDGVDKHRSTIGDYAFIGCNTNLVSPVNIADKAYTAAGSTITKDVPKESLGIARARQVNKEGWVAYKHPEK